MLNKSILPMILATGVFLASFPLAAQDKPVAALPDNVPELLVKINAAYVAKDYPLFRDALQRLNQMRPNNSDYMYQLVIAHALLDDKQQAYDLMLRMQQQGLAYDFSLSDDTLKIRKTEAFDYINHLLKMAADPVGESEPVLTLPAEVVLPETIRWDESRQKFLIGTMAEGSILAVGKDGEIKELLKADDENGMWAILDILIDLPRKRLWVSSASIPRFLRFDVIDQGRSALFEFKLETLEFVRRYPVPVDGQPHVLGSMVLSPNGDIYLADRAFPMIYHKPAGEQKLKALLVANDMVSLRGMAMQADGNILYAADREMGILVIDLKGQRTSRLIVPETLNLGGIDGLYLWENYLVVIQNGIKPQRVMRLQLDSSGTKVTAVRPLAVAQASFDFPSYGTLQEKDLYYFANSQWLGDEDRRQPVTVLRTPLDSSKDLIEVDMMKYFEERNKRIEEQQKKAEAKQ